MKIQAVSAQPDTTFSGGRAGPRPWRLVTATGVQSGWRLGEPSGESWLVLHGGPGSGASPALLAAFDEARHAAWGPHQRGSAAAGWHRAGRLPVAAMVTDLEALRVALAIPRWSVLGGSWGAYLALAYLRRYPAAVERLVLRGSFLARAADVWGLVRAMPAGALRQAGLPPPTARSGLPAWLNAVHRLFRFATPGPASALVAHAWLMAEGRTVLLGARRALLHASDLEPASEATAARRLRAAWRDLRRSERRGAAALRMQRPVPPAQVRKVALQARLLSRGCDHLLRGAVPGWRGWLAQAAATQPSLPARASVQIVHGRFDAVCSPRNARCVQDWFAGPVDATPVHAGHLATEPAMAQALKNAVRGKRAEGG